MSSKGRARSSGYGRLQIFVAIVSISFSLPTLGVAQLGGRPEKSNLTISYIQASGAFTILWVAQEAGLFKKNGLDVTLKLLNSQVSAQALIAGELDVISIGPDLVNARLQGAPVKYIGGTLQRFVFQLWGVKGLNSVADLKGKTVAVTTPRTSTEIATREALKKTGVLSDKDVSFLYVQTIPAILTSLVSGKTAAGTLSAPNTLKARDAGLSLVLDIAQANVPGLHLAYGTTERTIKASPNSLYAFLKALAEATVLAKQNPTLAKKAIGKYTDTEDVKIIDGTYEQFSPYWDATLAVRNEPIQGQLLYLDEKEFPRAKDTRPSDFIENSFAENLKTSGFLQALGVTK
ncbi:MAG TPA: ABC transporter substrate-binding protein [Candidatus Udaeobacter sp.]|nr:ABC transporter substrate-binding protein [Candidatus Udaeobacter sp.]